MLWLKYSYRLNSCIYHRILLIICIPILLAVWSLVLIPASDSIQSDQILIQADNDTRNIPQLIVSTNDTKLLPLIKIIHQNTFHRKSCRIEVFGGYVGVEQLYISGTLFRYISETCSCYLHYQPIEKFSTTDHQSIESISNESINVGRIVWCVLGCPDDVIAWCKSKKHTIYCQKYVILFDLLDEALIQPIGHYAYFAAVYRHYLRHDSGNYLTYLTNDLRRLLNMNELKDIHRVLNWTLAVNIMKEEWKNVGMDVNDLSTSPSLDLLKEINNRILTRILVNNEGVTYHTWPNLDVKIRQSNSKKWAVFWFPIGFTMTYLYGAAQTSVGPISHRKKLWTWMGSMKENERTDMIQRFELNDTLANYIRQRGLLLITGASHGGLVNMDYTAELLDSQFIPLPRGYSPEQYRSYEAVESGAIPVVHEQWLKMKESFALEPLAYLNILGYDPPTLTNFSSLPEKLLQLSRLPLDLLDNWQSIMLRRHRIIMRTLAKHIARVVCATSTPNGYVHREDQETS